MSTPLRTARRLPQSRPSLRQEILDGLNSEPRRLPSKLFYDARGAELFDAITRTNAYYPTRAEIEILQNHAADIAKWAGPHAHVIEFGSGSGIKTQILLDALVQPARYTPIDVSRDQLMEYAARLRAERPELEVTPLNQDYTHDLELPRSHHFGRTIAFFPGSTIGNFEPDEAQLFLKRVRAICGTGGGLLIGVDLRKDVAVLNHAYNDPEGITAEFNRNILRHVNAVIGSAFDPDAFEHHAFFNEDDSRIEMHLLSRVDQVVPLNGQAGLHFRQGEAIVTEYSYKYTIERFAGMAAEAGFVIGRTLTDARGLFSVHLLDAA